MLEHINIYHKNRLDQSLPVSVPEGDMFYTDITTLNTTDSEPEKTFACYFGQYHSGRNIFYLRFGHTNAPRNISKGEMTETISQSARHYGTYDCIAGFGYWDSGMTEFIWDEIEIITDAINITMPPEGGVRVDNVDLYTNASLKPSLTLTIPQGETFYVDITLINTTGSEQQEDLCISFNNGNHFAFVAQDITVLEGTHIYTMICQALEKGEFDSICGTGHYDSGSFWYKEYVYIFDSLKVT